MNLVFFLLSVYFYLVSLDVRLAVVKIFFSGQKSAELCGKIGQEGGRNIIKLGKIFLGMKFEISIPHDQLPEQYMVIGNHQSLLDILVCMAGFNHDGMRFVAKKELGANFPGASRVLRFGRHSLISRYSNLRQTADELKLFARRIKAWKYNPVIFPEGTRSTDGTLLEFKPGAYRILQSELKLPTVVAAIDGGYKYSHVTDFFHKNPYTYRMEVVGILPAPQSKKDLLENLQTAEQMIREKLESWNSAT